MLFCDPSTEAVGNIISFLGMQPCERSDKVPENKNSHVLFLSGKCCLSGLFCTNFYLKNVMVDEVMQDKNRRSVPDVRKIQNEPACHVLVVNRPHRCYLMGQRPSPWQSLTHLLSGVFRGGHDVLVRARLALADGVTMQVTVRSTEETVVDVILASVG